MTDDRFAPEEDSFPQGSKKLSLPSLTGGAEERGGGIQNMKFQKKIISPCHDFVETSPFRQGGLMATSPYNRRQTTGSRRKILRRVAPQYDKAGDRPQTADNRFTAKDDSFFTKS